MSTDTEKVELCFIYTEDNDNQNEEVNVEVKEIQLKEINVEEIEQENDDEGKEVLKKPKKKRRVSMGL